MKDTIKNVALAGTATGLILTNVGTSPVVGMPPPQIVATEWIPDTGMRSADGYWIDEAGLPWFFYGVLEPMVTNGPTFNPDLTGDGTLEGQPQYGRPDGVVDLNDLGFYLDRWKRGAG